MPSKRKPKKRRAPPARAPKKSKKKRAPKRAPPKRSGGKRARSEAAKRGWVTRRKRAKALARERDSDRGDVEVISKEPGAWTPAADYSPFAIRSKGGQLFVRRRSDVEIENEIEWFPTFAETYDYIDALVEDYDLDAHELFELAYGYQDEVIG